MTDVIHGLTIDGTVGVQLSGEGGWMELDSPREQFPTCLLLLVVSLTLAVRGGAARLRGHRFRYHPHGSARQP